MHWTVANILEATGGRLLQGDAGRHVARISTDSRRIEPDECFVPLTGETFDGHDFIPAALARGVRACIVQARHKPVTAPGEVSLIEVPDTLCALGDLARYCRRRHTVPVVGITGSNGKTSTKEMLAAILEQSLRVLKNQGNFNNLVGAPLTLLELQPHHQVAIVEMGINVPGEMARLVEIVQPSVGLITNIHPAHLEGLKSPDDILAEKGQLWQSLKPDDLAVVNLDDQRLQRLSRSIAARRVTYSLADRAAHVRMVGDVRFCNGGAGFRLVIGADTVDITLPVLGMHQAQNALAAAAAAYGLCISPDQIARGLARHQPVRQRMQLHPLGDGTTIVNDTYNANPQSVLAAVRTVAAIGASRPIVVVLGEMRELGGDSAVLHRQVGSEIGRLPLDQLITLGELALEINRGAIEAGLDPARSTHAASHLEIVERLRNNWPRGGWILVKGSRGMTMEKVVEGILAQ
jgi:UDP-N-acetylmuramoyl-tripeptide--D-alanyl-D-alanine ligase